MDINRLKEELINQRKSKFKGNIYHYLQVNFAYNSNKIEGEKLSEDELEKINNKKYGIVIGDQLSNLDMANNLPKKKYYLLDF